MFLNLLDSLSDIIKTSFLIKLPDSSDMLLGEQYGPPEFQITVHNERGLQALKSGKELDICEAYIDEDIDLSGNIDMLTFLDITHLFSKEHPLMIWLAKMSFLFKRQITVNRKSIGKHYEFDDRFYLYFLDKTRAYSHGLFLDDSESLEKASKRKLEFAMNACHLSSGAKVLDLGAGWGCALEYLGGKGIHVDGITISNHQAHFIKELIKTKKLSNCHISNIDFLNYEPPQDEYYDGLVSLGSLEHLPNYQQILKRCDKLLRKGAYAYFDASATASKKFINSQFINRHIFPGNHQCLDIYRFLKAVKNSSFDLISLHNDTHNYYLTLKAWASNLDQHKEEIIQKWGQTHYRKFQIYLWGCCYAMLTNELQAYRIVLRKR